MLDLNMSTTAEINILQSCLQLAAYPHTYEWVKQEKEIIKAMRLRGEIRELCLSCLDNCEIKPTKYVQMEFDFGEKQ